MRTLIVAFSALALVPTGAIAAPIAVAQESLTHSISGDFVRKQKSIKGGWHVEQRGDQTFIVFEEGFSASRGPDLKVFLSPKNLSDVTGKTATEGAVLLGELQSTKGGQEYIVPEGISLAEYESLLVHCEAYSVLWGGGAL